MNKGPAAAPAISTGLKDKIPADVEDFEEVP
jgi:hypothetical protein